MSTQDTAFVFKGGTVLSMDPGLGEFEIADVLVRGSRIAAVRRDLDPGDAQVIDAAGTIVLPGLVNAHQHAWLGLLRGLMPNVDAISDYMTALPFGIGRFYDPGDSYLSTLLTSLSCLDAGITSIIDACHNTRSPAHADAAVAALEKAGIRALHIVGKPLDVWPESWPVDIERLQKEKGADDALLRLGVFGQPDSVETSWPLARRLGLRILTEHVGPGPLVADLAAKGLLGPDNIFNHCTRLPDSDWKLLAAAGVNITTNPRSDALFGFEAGGFPMQAAREHGLRAALGIDIDTSMSGDLFGEMRAAFFNQRSIAQTQRIAAASTEPKAITTRAILEAATIDGAHVMGLGDRTGSLTPGKQADIIMIRTDGVGVFPSHNAIGTVVHMVDRADVDTVMVAGRLRKRGGRLLDIDMAKLKRETAAARARLFAKAGYTPAPFEDAFPALKPAA